MKTLEKIPREAVENYRNEIFDAKYLAQSFYKTKDSPKYEGIRKVVEKSIHEYLSETNSQINDFDTEDKDKSILILQKVIQKHLDDNKENFENVPVKTIKESARTVFKYLYSREKNWPDQKIRDDMLLRIRNIKLIKIKFDNLSDLLRTVIQIGFMGLENSAQGMYMPISNTMIIFESEALTEIRFRKVDENDDQSTSQIKQIMTNINTELEKMGMNMTIIHELFHAVSCTNFWEQPYHSVRRLGIESSRPDESTVLRNLNEGITDFMTGLSVANALKEKMPFIILEGKKIPLEKVLIHIGFINSYHHEIKVIQLLIKHVPFKYFRRAYIDKKELLALNRKIKEEFGITLTDIGSWMEIDIENPEFESRGFKDTISNLTETINSI